MFRLMLRSFSVKVWAQIGAFASQDGQTEGLGLFNEQKSGCLESEVGRSWQDHSVGATRRRDNVYVGWGIEAVFGLGVELKVCRNSR